MPRTIRVRSRNHSAGLLRNQVRCARPTVLRLGSFTPTNQIFTPAQIREGVVEINTVQSCQNSNDKFLMKQCFDNCAVPTANWALMNNTRYVEGETAVRIVNAENKSYNYLRFPLIIKNRHSSRGRGIYFVENASDYTRYFASLNTSAHIIEEYKNYSKEYRVHASSREAFYANRKMLLNDVPEEQRFHRHHENTVWIVPENPNFVAPANMEEIKQAAINAILSVGLTIGCVDVKVQQNRAGRDPEFIILETNSGPALGELTAPLYINELTQLITSR